MQKAIAVPHNSPKDQWNSLTAPPGFETSGASDWFLAHLVHDLRNPLACVVASAHLLREQTPPGDARDESLNILLSEAIYLDHLIHALVCICSNHPVRLFPSVLAEDLELAIGQMRLAAQNRSIAIRLAPTSHSSTALVDSELLQAALHNLLYSLFSVLRAGATIDASIIEGVSNASVEIVLRTIDPAGRPPSQRGPALLQSLPFVLARRLLERQHGQLTVNSSADGPTLRVRFAVAEPTPLPAEQHIVLAEPEGSQR